MNGRVYDPLTGTFLSPDPYIQSPDFTQNYNRYGYAFGNPLKYTDPTGEKFRWWHVAVMGVFGMNSVSTVINLAKKDHVDGGDIAAAAGQYIVDGIIFIATAGTSSAYTGFHRAAHLIISNVFLQGTKEGVRSAVNGGDFFDGFKKGAIRGLVTGACMIGLSFLGNLPTKPFGDLNGHLIYNETIGFKINYYIKALTNGLLNSSDDIVNMSTLVGYSSMADLRGSNVVNELAEPWKDEDPGIGLDFYYDAVDGMAFNDGSIMSRSDFVFTLDSDSNANARYLGFIDGKHHINFSIVDYEVTEANVRAITIHEAYGHGVMGYHDKLKNHHKAYFASIDSKYWEATTGSLKSHNVNKMYNYYYRETGSSNLPSVYLNEFWKYQTLY